VNIKGFDLVRTCVACPEQYDVYWWEDTVAYLRLRHGVFYAACPDVGGDIVYRVDIGDDAGVFLDTEREHYLTAAIDAIIEHRKKGT
jgi:hypothetical protein